MKTLPLLLLVFLIFSQDIYAEKIIWSGEVNSDGNATPVIKLELGKKYQITASGAVNLGKWVQQGKPLGNDACYEFGDGLQSKKIETLKNSINFNICQGDYNPEHFYKSKPFTAFQNGVHFWIQDTDYEDNSGALKVQLIQVDDN